MIVKFESPGLLVTRCAVRIVQLKIPRARSSAFSARLLSSTGAKSAVSTTQLQPDSMHYARRSASTPPDDATRVRPTAASDLSSAHRIAVKTASTGSTDTPPAPHQPSRPSRSPPPRTAPSSLRPVVYSSIGSRKRSRKIRERCSSSRGSSQII
jgi:hypothetical protein